MRPEIPKRGSREFDAMVAEKVMGWTENELATARLVHGWPLFLALDGDYSVLVKVREEWDISDQSLFMSEILEQLRTRIDRPSGYWGLFYEAGDYAEAALRVRCAA